MAEAAEDAYDPRLEEMLEGVLSDWPDIPPLPHLEVHEAAVWEPAPPPLALDAGRLLLDVREAAQRRACSRSLLYELITAGELGFIQDRPAHPDPRVRPGGADRPPARGRPHSDA